MQVFTARLEANDNMKYLRTLEDWFDKLNDDGDFPKLLEVSGMWYCMRAVGRSSSVARTSPSNCLLGLDHTEKAVHSVLIDTLPRHSFRLTAAI